MRFSSYFSFFLTLFVASTSKGEDSFSTWVSKRCLHCHSGFTPSANLDLTSRPNAERGGDSGAAWTPEAPLSSLIWEAVKSGTMPPDSPLSDGEVAKLKAWIDQEKLWPAEPIDPIAYTSDIRAGYDWWAFQPLRSDTGASTTKISHQSIRLPVSTIDLEDENATPTPSSPAPSSPAPASSVIDKWIDEKLEQSHLRRSPRAPHEILRRRLHYGITGLPPESTANDTETYIELVDRLLASPEYGEKFGRYWLDLVRFGETNGFEYDEPRNHFWRYRNWVIQALNDDMPYDKFVQMQLAGDAIVPDSADGKIAMGFLVAGPHNTTRPSGNELVKVAMEEDELEELVGTIGQTFLGMTIHCARCHDHKFDPISQQNYYEFAANFAGVNHGETSVTLVPSEGAKRKLEQLKKDIAQLRSQVNEKYESTSQRIVLETESKMASKMASKFELLQSLPSPILQWPTPLAGRIHLSREWAIMGNPIQDAGRPFEIGLTTSPGPHQGGIRFDGSFYLESQAVAHKNTTIGPTNIGAANNSQLSNSQSNNSPSSNSPSSIGAKTLSAWVLLDNLEQQGSGILTVQSRSGELFDGIVFGELKTREWLSGSDNHRRTQNVNGPLESEGTERPVHIAITYAPDGQTQIFRNGTPYGESYIAAMPLEFNAIDSSVLIGLRHTPARGNRHLHGTVFYAALFDRVLSSSEIALQATADFLEMQKSIALGTVSSSLDLQDLQKQLQQVHALEKELNQFQRASEGKVYTSVGRSIGERRVYHRGDVSLPGELVKPAPLHALKQPEFPANLSASSTDQERRFAIATWLTSKDNALFARVMANRVWMYHMGQSLVKTPSDFGFNAGEPTHPELLDYLAQLLIDNEFRLKPLHRAILLSETYRQRSNPTEGAMEVDASNSLYWRKLPERLEAEEVRDSVLAIADRLSLERDGIGYRDMQQTMEKGTNVYRLIDLSNQLMQLRTVYRFSPRGNRNPFLDNFDCPDPSVATPQRSQTTTPLQALSLLNNALIYSVCDSLTDSIQEAISQQSREKGINTQELSLSVIKAYQKILLRNPSPDELNAALEFAAKHGLSNFCRVLFNTNEFLYVQ